MLTVGTTRDCLPESYILDSGSVMRWKLVVYVLAVVALLAAASFYFAPAERCAVVPALQIGEKVPRC